MSLRIEKRKLLIVDGRDDEQFFNAALRAHPRIDDIQVMPIRGKTELSQSLSALILDPNFASVESLAIVRDADTTDSGTSGAASLKSFDSVRDSLKRRQLASPASHGQFADGQPRVGIFIVPNAVSDGMLETLCLESVSIRPDFRCVNDYVQCLQQQPVILGNLDKAREQAWLASQPRPGRRVGEAAAAGYWPWHSPAFASLWSWIRAR